MVTRLHENCSTAQKLKDTILSYNRIMGDTLTGKDWCIKALHPADPTNEVRGVPDESSVPSLMMNYQSVYTISPTDGATGTWSLDGQLIPNPMAFGCALYTDSIGNHSVEFVNTQIPGADHASRLTNFLRDFQRWRLAYASVTIYQDGPDLANQGTVVVCQKPIEPARFNVYPQYDMTTASESGKGFHHVFHMDAADMPDYTASQAMPNAYFGKSKEGAYIPLKLTKTHQVWHSHRDLTYQAGSSSVVSFSDPSAGGSMNISNSTNAVTTGAYPFLSMNDFHVQLTEGNFARFCGQLTSDFCNENWADFSFRNMATTTSLSMFFRFGFEVQTQPTSTLAPHLKLSPPSDPKAIESYFAISRELKDAYPADYNDLGKIWDVISSVAKKAAPALSAVPVVGGMLPGVLRSAIAVGDRVRQAAKNSSGGTRGSVASAADVEVMKDYKNSNQTADNVPPRSASAPLTRRQRKPSTVAILQVPRRKQRGNRRY